MIRSCVRPDNIFLELECPVGTGRMSSPTVSLLSTVQKGFGCCDVIGVVHINDFLEAVGLQMLAGSD